MSWIRPYILPGVLAILAIVLQGLLSDAISISYATPNFFLVFTLIICAIHPTFGSVVLAFILGLLYNLLCSGTVGAMALVLTILAFVVVELFSRMEQSNFLFSLLFLVIAVFLADVLYGLLSGMFVSGISVSQAFPHRALPCGVYDVLICAVLYPLSYLLNIIISNAGANKQSAWKI